VNDHLKLLTEASSSIEEEMPLRLIDTALQQTIEVETRVQSAISLILINESHTARALWWGLARVLSQPLHTLMLISEAEFGPVYAGASVAQLRKWQLEQLAVIVMHVDDTCYAKDQTLLAVALETRVMPWLANLKASLDLLRETQLLGLMLRQP